MLPFVPYGSQVTYKQRLRKNYIVSMIFGKPKKPKRQSKRLLRYLLRGHDVKLVAVVQIHGL